MARSTAEGGMMMTETTFRPIDLYRIFGSIHNLGPANLTMLSFVDNLLLRDQRGLLLTGMLDSMRISDGTRIRRRAFAGYLVLGMALSLVIAVYLNIKWPYMDGALRLDMWMEQQSPVYSFNEYTPYFSPKQVLDPSASWQIPVFFVVGMVVCLFLTLMRTAFHWWPLHPLGYALAGSWTTTVFWFPCLFAWLCKWLRDGARGICDRGGVRATTRPLQLACAELPLGIAPFPLPQRDGAVLGGRAVGSQRHVERHKAIVAGCEARGLFASGSL
jgi:hypothetical protein